MTMQSVRMVDHPLLTDLLKRSGVTSVADARRLLKQTEAHLKEMHRLAKTGPVSPAHRDHVLAQQRDCQRMILEADEEERSCLGKERYPSRDAAEGALRFFRADIDRHRRGQLESYPCRFCGHHHLGHVGRTNGEERRRQARAKNGRAA